jgi:hypothetical protein
VSLADVMLGVSRTVTSREAGHRPGKPITRRHGCQERATRCVLPPTWIRWASAALALPPVSRPYERMDTGALPSRELSRESTRLTSAGSSHGSHFSGPGHCVSIS